MRLQAVLGAKTKLVVIMTIILTCICICVLCIYIYTHICMYVCMCTGLDSSAYMYTSMHLSSPSVLGAFLETSGKEDVYSTVYLSGLISWSMQNRGPILLPTLGGVSDY